MAFLTDRKRADGLGSAKQGTEHHWSMQVNSVALLALVPLFVFTFGSILGASHEEVVLYYSRPFPALVAGLTLLVGMIHFKMGVQVLIEDYTQGQTRTWLIIGTKILSYGVAAAGVFAVARIAL